MPTDEQIIRHLAGVMGWFPCPDKPGHWENSEEERITFEPWNPLADTTLGKGQAMEVWERAREMGIDIVAYNDAHGWHGYQTHRPILTIDADSGSRAICLAVYRATGGKDA